MISIESYNRHVIELFMNDDMFDKEIIHDSNNITIIKWINPDRIAVYVPKDKEKDLSKLSDDMKEKIAKELI